MLDYFFSVLAFYFCIVLFWFSLTISEFEKLYQIIGITKTTLSPLTMTIVTAKLTCSSSPLCSDIVPGVLFDAHQGVNTSVYLKSKRDEKSENCFIFIVYDFKQRLLFSYPVCLDLPK